MENVSEKFKPIFSYLNDDSISEIMVNRHNLVFIEKEGKISPTTAKFESEMALQELIQEIALSCGREIHRNHPFMDAYLPDGSRVNAVIPPMAPKGASLTIRKFRKAPFSLQNYIEIGSLTDKAAFFLHACIMARMNLIVSGGTGSGKTTFLNALSGLIPENQRIITIEDVAELNLRHPNWVRLESVLVPNGDPVTTRDCLINALRMRPDRIIVGECRRSETFEMLQAMNTGHDGSMTTVHANSPRDCLTRIESLIIASGIDAPIQAMRKQMSSAVDLIVQLKRDKTGQRLVTDIVEVTGMEENTITTQTLFSRKKEGSKASEGDLNTIGLVPSFMPKFAENGIQFPPNFFDPNTKVTYRAD